MDCLGPSVDDQTLPSQNLPKESSKTPGVATFEPYLPAVDPKKSWTKNGNFEYRNKRNREILPGLSVPTYYIQYLTIKHDDDQRMQNSDFFEIHRQIVTAIGREPKIVFQGDGSVLVEVTSLEEKEKLLSLTAINGRSAKCAPHKLMNQCKGVIRAPLLMQFSEERLQKEFEDQSVIEVKQMKKKIDGVLTPMPTYVLTFDLSRLPKEIKAAWLYFDVRPYIPLPRRCFYCHRFGHVTDTCRRKIKGEKKICHNCGQDEHGDCENNSFCINCRGNHPSVSKKCDRYVMEKEILTVRAKEHTTYSEAKKKVLSQCIRPGVTFASVTKAKPIVNDIIPNFLNNQKSPSVPKRIPPVNPAKRRLSREEQDDSPISKSNRFEILTDELDCVGVESSDPNPDNDSLGRDLTPAISHFVAQAEVHAPASSQEQYNSILASSQSDEQGEVPTLVSAPDPTKADTLVCSQEQEKAIAMECSPLVEKNHSGDELLLKASSNLKAEHKRKVQSSNKNSLPKAQNSNISMPKVPILNKSSLTKAQASDMSPLPKNAKEKKGKLPGKTSTNQSSRLKL